MECEIEIEIDARGLLCPLPVLKLRKAVQGVRPGCLVRIILDDPAARIDVPHYCAEAGHSVVEETSLGQRAYAYVIRREA